MFSSWRRQTSWAWIACFAVLLNALAPAISHALAAQRSADPFGLAALCSSSGPGLPAALLAPASAGKTASANPVNAAPGKAAPATPAAPAHLEHCPFCLPHAGSAGLLNAPMATGMALASGPDLLPALFLQAPRSQPVWLVGQPRAPPLFA